MARIRSTCPLLLGALLIATISLGGGLDAFDRSTLDVLAGVVRLAAGPAADVPQPHRVL
jgi:hypothetical protein